MRACVRACVRVREALAIHFSGGGRARGGRERAERERQALRDDMKRERERWMQAYQNARAHTHTTRTHAPRTHTPHAHTHHTPHARGARKHTQTHGSLSRMHRTIAKPWLWLDDFKP